MSTNTAGLRSRCATGCPSRPSVSFLTVVVFPDPVGPRMTTCVAIARPGTVYGRPTPRSTPTGTTRSSIVTAAGAFESLPAVSCAFRNCTDPNSTLVSEWRYRYDNLERKKVAESNVRQPDGNYKRQRQSYGYDSPGRLTQYTDEQGPHTIGYDANSNRTSFSNSGGNSAVTQRTAYNPDDSIRSTNTGKAGATDQVSRYEADGTLRDDGCYTYTYDGFDRLRSSTPIKESDCGDKAAANASAQYDYDGLDRQRQRVQNTKSTLITYWSDGSQTRASRYETATTDTNYDGLTDTVTAEAEQGKAATRYTLDPAGNSASATSQPASGTAATDFLVDDGFGTITSVTGQTSGDAAQPFVRCATRFDPWGRAQSDPTVGGSSGGDTTTGGAREVTSQPPGTTESGKGDSGSNVGLAPSPCAKAPTDGTSATASNIWYRGERRDPATGNYQLGSRVYDPSKAAFQSQDTYRDSAPEMDLALGTDPLTSNRYTYVNGDPVNLHDPDGHEPHVWSDGTVTGCSGDPNCGDHVAGDGRNRPKVKAGSRAARQTAYRHNLGEAQAANSFRNKHYEQQFCGGRDLSQCRAMTSVIGRPYVRKIREDNERELRAVGLPPFPTPFLEAFGRDLQATADWLFFDDVEACGQGGKFSCVLVAANFIPGGKLGKFGSWARVSDDAAEAGASSRLVPGGGLAAHEAAGGHALARHLGQSDADLMARVAGNPRISGASTFGSRATAEASVADVLGAGSNQIQGWLAGTGGKLVLNGRGTDAVGRYVAQGSSSVVNAYGTRVVLVRDSSLGTGYRVQTAFPTP